MGSYPDSSYQIGKLGGTGDYYHPLRSTAIAGSILDEIGCFTKIEKRRILALIENHALIGNITIHGEQNEYPKSPDDHLRVNGRVYSKGRLYAIGPISDRQYVRESLKQFFSFPSDFDVLLLIQLADTYAVKRDGSYLSERTVINFTGTYEKLKAELLRAVHSGNRQVYVQNELPVEGISEVI